MPAAATVEINGTWATLFKDTEPPIYLMTDGRFAVKYGGLWKIRGSIAPLLKMIGRFQSAVKMMRVGRMYEQSVMARDSPTIIEAVTWERGIIGLKDGKRIKERYQNWYIHDEKIVKELDALYAECHKLELAHQKAVRVLAKKHNAICKRLKAITEGSFRNVVNGIDAIRPRDGKAVRRAET